MSNIYIIIVDFQITKILFLIIPFCPGLPYCLLSDILVIVIVFLILPPRSGSELMLIFNLNTLKTRRTRQYFCGIFAKLNYRMPQTIVLAQITVNDNECGRYRSRITLLLILVRYISLFLLRPEIIQLWVNRPNLNWLQSELKL